MGRQKHYDYVRPDPRRVPESERQRDGDQRFEGLFPGCDITGDELEFGKAMDRWKRENRQPFPTCSEVLAVAKSLGYRKVPCLIPVGD